jgi:hypothetical protein
MSLHNAEQNIYLRTKPTRTNNLCLLQAPASKTPSKLHTAATKTKYNF